MKRFIALMLAGMFLSSAFLGAQTSGTTATNDSESSVEPVASGASEAGSNYLISLLTCGPGDQLYSTFGHSALRVRNLATGVDDVYNFGMFDFSDPDFYLKFIKGDLDYYLGVQEFENFVAEYSYENRYVYEQTLSLTAIQTDRILSELDFRNLPENRAYKYKFLQRNCTTELRDIISEAVEQSDYLSEMDSRTWRYYLNSCLTGKVWAKTGINIILGSRVDVPITNFEKMFLPESLSKELDLIEAGGGLEASNTMLVPDNRQESVKGFFAVNYPYILLIIIALIVILVNSRTVDFIYCLLLGLVGLLVVFLMFYSTHIEFQANYSLLLFNPLFIVLGIAVLSGRLRARRRSRSYTPHGQSHYGRRGSRNRVTLARLLGALCTVGLLTLALLWILGIQGFETGIIIMFVPALWIAVKYTVMRSNRHKALS